MKTNLLFFLVLLTSIQVSISQTVNIPDVNFETALINLGIDTNGPSGNILLSDAVSVNALNVSTKDISNLEGIEAFVNLTSLYCNNNDLSSIDISNLTALGAFQCANNQLTSLNTQNNTNLKSVHISSNLISSLDLSTNTLLENISCDFNDISSLDLSNNLALISLSCSQNNLTTLNVTNNNSLIHLNFGQNNLSSIDVSNNNLLEDLLCNNNALTAIDITNNTLLEEFYAYGNSIKTIDASNNNVLTDFSITNNQLVSVNIKNGNNTSITSFSTLGNPNLICIEVDDASYSTTNWSSVDAQTNFSESCPTIAIPDANFEQALIDLGYDTNGVTGDILQGEAEAITILDVSNKSIGSLEGIEGFVNLTELSCQDNNLTSLDIISNNNNLELLICGNNQLTNLDLSNNPMLGRFLGDNNQLESLNIKNGNNNNSNATYFSALNNPNLTCVEVDDVTYSNANWFLGIDAQTSFSESCGPATIAIPDTNFEQALIDAGFDTNGLNGNILQTEAEAVTDMSLGFDFKGINNLQGIEGFINLVQLNVFNNNLSIIDISNNLNLEVLHVSNNFLTSLDVSNNLVLKELFCYTNQLTSLDVSANTTLIKLECGENQLTNLDVSNNVTLEHLVCSNNQLESLDISSNPSINVFNCKINQLTSLNAKSGNNTNITTFNTTNNANLTCILVDDVAHSEDNWTSIDAQTSFNDVECVLPNIAIPDANFEQALIDLGFDTNGLNGNILQTEAEAVTSLDVHDKFIASLQGIEGFINLTTLHCQINELTSLDVSSNIALVELSCNSNQITSLDLSSNILLQRLYCSNTELTTLDVSNNTALTQINCFSNQLQSLNVKNGNNTSFTLFNATDNPNLFCVEVDNIAHSQDNWTNIDAQTSFNTACSNEPVIAIPDANFEQALINLGFDTNGLNGNILQTEAEAVTSLDVHDEFIDSLQGIEGFINLEVLICFNNNISTLDVSNNTQLRILHAQTNQLSNLDTSNNLVLEELHVSQNELTSLDLSNNSSLLELGFAYNNFTNIDVSNNSHLYELSCFDNLISSLDISNNNELEFLDIRDNTLTSLNARNGNNTNFFQFRVTGNPNLVCIEVDDVAYSTANWSGDVDAQSNFSENCATIAIPDPNFELVLFELGFDTNGLNGTILQTEAEAVTLLNVSGRGIANLQGIEGFVNLTTLQCNNNDLTNLDLSSNTALSIVECKENDLTSIDISNSTTLARLYCSENNLAALDISNNTQLQVLECHINELTNIDISNNSILVELYVGHNQLLNIDVSNNSLLEKLYCHNNQLDNLDVSNNSLLEELGCSINQLTSLDVSSNAELITLNCRDNQISSLDVSSNNVLEILFCDDNNYLTSLNVRNGNNINTSGFSATGNPYLTCIEVDDVAYSTANWSNGIDAQSNFSENCATIVISDINFEQALIDLGIDTNGLNGNMFQVEAEAVTVLDVSNKSIYSLQGIEGFVNLTELNCQGNNLTSLDIISNNNLELLICGNNQLRNLDLSNNPMLGRFLGDNNQLESLNIKNGNNSNATYFSALNNPNLTCIEVDDATYSNANWYVGIDAQTSFSEDCSSTLSIGEVNVLDNVKLHPNPTSGRFFIKGLQEDSTIKVYDINSKLIISQSINNNEAIDISNVPSGLYFINISNNTGSTVKKLIIQ